jgi:hypothetical protein
MYFYSLIGVPDMAEIIPFEPDTGNAGVGSKNSFHIKYSTN